MLSNKTISTQEQAELIKTLQKRFEKYNERHKSVKWKDVYDKLLKNPDKLWSLNNMESTGGEPDVVEFDEISGEYIFMDCSAETPKGRRSLCYDRTALEARKEYKPINSAIDVANEMGVEMLTEEMYRKLQTVGNFDTKTSSWVITPAEIRQLGGAIFCDRRYNHVFTYHNGAESYYAVRGFRTLLRV